MKDQIKALAHPSLALIKYWGKSDKGLNSPATGSIAISLEEFTTTTSISLTEEIKNHDNTGSTDLFYYSVLLNGEKQVPSHFLAFFEQVTSEIKNKPGLQIELKKSKPHLRIISENNFPTAAGLASSSSGFAALAKACAGLFELEMTDKRLSNLARTGSGSASRAIFGGFTKYPQNSLSAQSLYPKEYWPDLRVIVVEVSDQKKSISSRKAMELSRTTSPYYKSWIEDSKDILMKAEESLRAKDLETLGSYMRLSYLRMFSTMFSSNPPTIYWLPKSLEIIQLCEKLRNQGLLVFETMDAGPQVKLLCLEQDKRTILESIKDKFPELLCKTSKIGGPSIIV